MLFINSQCSSPFSKVFQYSVLSFIIILIGDASQAYLIAQEKGKTEKHFILMLICVLPLRITREY